MKKIRFYAGIGSRETSPDVLKYMTEVAERLARVGFILRSGGAKGADTAFEKGAGKAKAILRPKHATEASIREASRYHPAWYRCDSYAQRLHGRNVLIILGEDSLDDEEQWVEFVVCWTSTDVTRGGTRLGINIAKDRAIPVYNLAVSGEDKLFEKLLADLEKEAEDPAR